MKKGSKLLLALAACLALGGCDGCNKQQGAPIGYADFDSIDMIVVNKVPRGAYAGEEMPEEFKHADWYEIGLSRNGKEPIEYIWRADEGSNSYDIIIAEVGERGTIHLDERVKRYKIKLPRPNAKDPPIIGSMGEVYWERRE
jgi:hypothetical protein